MSYAARFFQMKDLIKIYIIVSLISIAFVVVKFKIFKVFRIDSAFMKWPPFLGFLDPCSLKYYLILLKFWLEVVSNKTNTFFEKSFKILNFGLNERTQSLQFWCILEPNLLPENQKYC